MNKLIKPSGTNILHSPSDLNFFRKDVLGFCHNKFTKFGDTNSFYFAHHQAYLSRCPHFINHILKTNPENYKKSFDYYLMKPIFGDYVIFEHCMPFNVTRAYEEAQGIKHPKIWTAEKDKEMWFALQASI
jgi:hypothetical protein